MAQLNWRFIGKITLFPKHSQNPRELWEPGSKSWQGLHTALHVCQPVLAALTSSNSLKPTTASQVSSCHYPPLYRGGKQGQEEIKQFTQGHRRCELESILSLTCCFSILLDLLTWVSLSSSPRWCPEETYCYPRRSSSSPPTWVNALICYMRWPLTHLMNNSRKKGRELSSEMGEEWTRQE